MEKQGGRKFGRMLTWLYIFTAVSVVLIVTMLVLAYEAIEHNDLSETEFIKGSFVEPIEACPGQILYIPITYEIKRAPLILNIFENWRYESVSVPFIIYGVQGMPHVFTKTGTSTNVLDVEVPIALPPGDYTYIRAWEETAKWPSFIEVKVKVEKCN